MTGTFALQSPHSGFPYALSPEFVEVLLRDLPAEQDAGQVQAALERSWLPANDGKGPLGPALAVDAQGWLPEDLLMKVDRTTMAHSLEARVPFLDHRVAELAFRMPASVKLRKGSGKAVLREACAELLGEELVGREKHGFDLPMGRWVRNELRPLIEATLGKGALPQTPWLHADGVAALLDAHARGRGDLERPIWSLFVLAAWFREIDRTKSHASSA